MRRKVLRNIPCILISVGVIVSIWAMLACRPVPPPTATPTPELTPTLPPEDKSSPYLAWSTPAMGAGDVSPETTITLHLRDDGAGLDVSSIVMNLGGAEVRPAIIQQGRDCTLTYRPENSFRYGESVHVEVFARDLAPAPNSSKIALAFTIAPRPKSFPPFLSESGNLRLTVVYYGKHNPETDSLIINISPQYIIANPPHGLWGEVYGPDTWWLLQDIPRYQAAGIKVIGYITAGYEAKGSGSGIELKWYTLEMNKKLIQDMATIDKVDGVFIDECHTFPDAEGKKYLKELTDWAHQFGLLAWGNVGSPEFDEWFFTAGGFDMINTREDWQGQGLSLVQQEWGDRISVTGFKSEYTAQSAFELTVDAWLKGLAYCYISETGYASLPAWIKEYKFLLREHLDEISDQSMASRR